MKPKLNSATILSIIGILQPTSAVEVRNYLQALFPDLNRLPSDEVIHDFCMDHAKNGWLLRVAREPNIFSLTELGNSYLPRELRLFRDKARIYLLKLARRGRLRVSREEHASELGGVAPPVDTSLNLKGPEANKIALVVPRGQSYWPRYSKQFDEKTGPQQSSRDDYFQCLSFSNVDQVALGCRTVADKLKLDYRTLGAMLGISPRLIVQIAHKPDRHYRQFPIPKRSGGTRLIDSPRVYLKVIQQFLLDYYLEGLPVSVCPMSP